MNKQIDFLDEISNFVFTSKYARYNEKAGRRETWDECVGRVEKMHLNKFKKLPKEDVAEIKWAFDQVRAKKAVPSLRSLQYGGKAIEANNARLFNCVAMHITSIRTFAEFMYLSLSGCGNTIGIGNKYISRLPYLANAKDKTGAVIAYTIEDTIEGWADSIEAILMSYFKNTAFTGRKIVFDYSKIRPEGSELKTSGGKAPGYKGLKRCHKLIKALLDHVIEDNGQDRLRPINAYDILMYCSDAVLSGGNRRSATMAVFDYDDTEMMQSKINFSVTKHTKFYKEDGEIHWNGKVTVNKKQYEVKLTDYEYENMLMKNNIISWIHIEPQRARSNNTTRFIRSITTKEQFATNIENTKISGDPAFLFANSEDELPNPCSPVWVPLFTKQGIKQLKDINIGDEIWSETGWTKMINKWSTGIKKVYKYQTTAGSFYGTENHRLVSNGIKTEAKDCETIDILPGQYTTDITIDPQDVVDGLMMGDGSADNRKNNNIVILFIGAKDGDYFISEIKPFIVKKYTNDAYCYKMNTTIILNELPPTYARTIPDRFLYGSKDKVCGFIRGLFSANGSVGGRVQLKGASKKLIEQVQIMLSSVGIKSYITTNKANRKKFPNIEKEYLCKESYNLCITTDRNKFREIIGFIQHYKNKALDEVIENTTHSKKPSKTTYDIKAVEFISEEEVFDITVENAPHTYCTGGLNVSNCAEAVFIPVTSTGLCGPQMCNLTSINGAFVKTQADFESAAKAAAIIGTLQATYTDFKYVTHISKWLTEDEALLGVSITGLMDNPEILLNPDNQKAAAAIVNNTNELWANKLSINPAARTTLVKPEGSNSILLKSASGIHPHHAHKYFRRIQCNKHDPVYKFFKKNNIHATEPSVWSANHTDDIVTFPLEIPKTAMIKADLTAIKHLEIIKDTQQNWVIPGTSKYNKKDIHHNCSCTVDVEENEWSSVIDYLFENRNIFTAVALVPASNDKLYKQSPMESIITPEDEIKWNTLIKDFKAVDYTKLEEKEDTTTIMETVACAGGACQLI